MTTQEFVNQLTSLGGEIVNKMQNCKTPEEAYAVAKETGVTDSFDDFVAEMTKIYESVKDLSEDDLEMVAGGGDPQDQDHAGNIVSAIATGLSSGAVTAAASITALLVVPALAASV
jgi:hypothetical protein